MVACHASSASLQALGEYLAAVVAAANLGLYILQYDVAAVPYVLPAVVLSTAALQHACPMQCMPSHEPNNRDSSV